jgi:hypothetical protein
MRVVGCPKCLTHQRRKSVWLSPSLAPQAQVWPICCRSDDVGRKGPCRRACLRSSSLDRTQKVALADVNAAMTQDHVGRRDVDIEIRQDEMVEVIVAFHVALVGRAERKCDLMISRRIDLLWVEGLQMVTVFAIRGLS